MNLPPEKLVAHAGGAWNRQTYTNSLEALNQNYDMGFRLFEVDLSLTTDNALVLLHDWNKTLKTLYKSSSGRLSHSDFMELETRKGWRQLDLDGLCHWMKKHPDALVITDVKEENVAGLAMVARSCPGLLASIIPQIYSPREYQSVRELGFEHIIFTLYRSKLSNEAILEFVERTSLYGITMPVPRALKKGFAQRLTEKGARVFVHTVNSTKKINELHESGIWGFYTDFIPPFNGHSYKGR